MVNYVMKKSVKAALLSALLFPGAGHFSLKRYIPGAIFAGVSIAAIYYLISKAMERGALIADKIQSGAVPLDATAIAELISQQSAGAEGHSLNAVMTVFFIIWLISIVDSYRLGCAQDKNNHA